LERQVHDSYPMVKNYRMTESVIIIGAGGHAKVLLNALQLSATNVIGLTDSDIENHGSRLLGCPVLGNDSIIDTYDQNDVRLIMGIGSTEPGSSRRTTFEHFVAKGFSFSNCIHPSAIVAPDVSLGHGSQIMAGTIVQPGCTIGINTIINTRASIDHDCEIGDHTHIAPGATLSGDVRVGHNAHVGAGGTIIQGISIGDRAMVVAGASVTRDIAPGERVAGVPAKVLKKHAKY